MQDALQPRHVMSAALFSELTSGSVGESVFSLIYAHKAEAVPLVFEDSVGMDALSTPGGRGGVHITGRDADSLPRFFQVISTNPSGIKCQRGDDPGAISAGDVAVSELALLDIDIRTNTCIVWADKSERSSLHLLSTCQSLRKNLLQWSRLDRLLFDVPDLTLNTQRSVITAALASLISLGAYHDSDVAFSFKSTDSPDIFKALTELEQHGIVCCKLLGPEVCSWGLTELGKKQAVPVWQAILLRHC